MGFIKTKTDFLDLPPKVNLLRQTYEKISLPQGVAVLKLSVYPDDQGGWFKEMLRLDEAGNVVALKEQNIEFKIKQTNMSYISAGGTKRFWHIHPATDQRAGQNEIWTTNATLLVGLVDLRKDSATHGMQTKIILSSEKAVYIPSGVAHGLLNPNNYPVTLVYFVDQYFTADEQTQEHRIDPKDLPFGFVEPEIL